MPGATTASARSSPPPEPAAAGEELRRADHEVPTEHHQVLLLQRGLGFAALFHILGRHDPARLQVDELGGERELRLEVLGEIAPQTLTREERVERRQCRLARGVELEDGRIAADKARLLALTPGGYIGKAAELAQRI